ncbi:cilia- and flagella-associated protein 61 isoform X1 [Cephus cinctus]|uniref:Cilia- and flagella-associated protein 61 isoform X1 n=1 Tax=Cephus cinctus TaxID=211228 RepID=A0AAJ7BY28_CEPCN|nr:cilia- and flagella-associated protein 61 isoform X1 [Cephus cinctus]
MTRILPKSFHDSRRIQALYVSFRHSHCPKLKIRRVVEEDNDDIVPILDRDSHRIKDIYGEYYISEMMRYPDGMRQLIVAEVDGLATGVLCLNRIVDIDVLNEYFELGPYRGLRKPHESDVIVMPDKVKTVSEILFHKESQELPDAGSILEEVEKIASNEHNIRPSIMRGRHSFKKTSGSNGMHKKVSINQSNEVLASPDDANSDDYGSDTSEVYRFKIVFRYRVLNTSNLAMQESPDSVSIKSTDSGLSRRDDDNDEPHESNHRMSVDDFESKLRQSIFAATIADLPTKGKSWGGKAEKPDSKASDSCETTVGVSKYYGEPNAFTMELFSMTPEIGERRAADYLGAAFECFPDRDFCVMLIPSTYHLFTFLQHFVRVPLRFNKDFPMVLYLAHRSTFLGSFKTREAVPFDRNDILEFLDGMPKKEAVLRDFDDSMRSGDQMESYIFLWEGSVVGLAILCLENDIDYLRSRYVVEDYVLIPNVSMHAHARLLHWVLMPIFSVDRRFFFRELMRLSSTSVVYYRLYENEASSLTRTHPLVSCLNVMIPVNPRKQIDYTYGHYEDNIPSDVILRKTEQKFSLFLMTAQMSMVTKSDVNTKFIIVGASDCGLAIAEHLAMWSDPCFMHFNNVTLVSVNGIPFERERNFLEYKMLPFRGRYCYEYRNHITARAWLNIVYGTMISIDRKDKYITIANMGTLSYDYLILTGGLQYQKPKFSEEIDAEKRGELKDFEIPSNCLMINDDKEASICFERFKHLINDGSEKYIVLYGHNIDCYCVLNVLLEYGIEASKITLIEPLSQICEDHDVAFLYDVEVDAAVIGALKETGTSVLAGWEITDWDVEEVGKEKLIRYLKVETKTETQKIPCDMLLNFNEKTICMKTFKAIAKAGLVFDGHLVIDPEYRTNDPFIFAAGTITKYSRKLGTEGWSHKYYNRIEVGETPFEMHNIISLYGKHNAMLNDVKLRYQNSLVPDLYSYFREPWATALFLDRFEGLQVQNRATLLSHTAMLKSVSPQLSPRGQQRIIRLTTDQEAVLQEQFNRSPRAPHTADVVLLAAETGLSEEDVQGWYAIRLAQWRKEQGLGGNLGFNN